MKYLFLLNAALVLLGVGSCSEPNTSSTTDPDVDTNEINFFLQNINSMKTRAGHDSPEDITREDPGFGIYIVDDPKELQTLGNRADNHQIKWGGSSWFNSTTQNTDIKLDWPAGATTVTAYAYCPYIPSITNVTSIPIDIKTDQSTLPNLKASDFIRAKAVNCQKNDGNIIPLTFSHRLTKLKFNIKWTDLNKIGTPTEIIFTELKWKGLYNLNMDELTVSSNQLTTPKGYIYNKTDKSATAEVIIMPQTKPAGKFVTIKTLRNGEEAFYILKLDSELAFKQNTQYNFNVFLNDTESTFDLAPADIEDWEEVENGDWNIDANVKKENVLSIHFESNQRGLMVVTTSSLPAHESTDVSVLMDGKFYQGNYISYSRDSCSFYPRPNNIGGKTYGLTLQVLDENYDPVEGTTVSDGLMSYSIEPSNIYIPASIHITPEYDKESGTLVFTASQNVDSDIIFNVFQYDEENSKEEAILTKGTATSQKINVSSWNKSKNAIITLKYKQDDIKYKNCCMIRENIYYHLEGTFWGSDFTQGYETYYLHIIL